MFKHYTERCIINAEAWMNKHPLLLMLALAGLFCLTGLLTGDSPK